jgi:polysaccharide export outer membrane protein
MSVKSLKTREFEEQLTLSVALLFGALALAVADDVAPNTAVAPDYRIGPGDTLKVSVFQNDELTATLPVRPDGKISTPLVEDMVAVGKTPSQLAPK